MSSGKSSTTTGKSTTTSGKSSVAKVTSLSNLGEAIQHSFHLARRKSSTTPLKIEMPSAYNLECEHMRISLLVLVEAQRIVAVLDDILLSLQIIARLSSVCENFEYFETLLGNEISSVFVYLCGALRKISDNEGEDRGLRSQIFDTKSGEDLSTSIGTKKGNLYTPLRRIRNSIKKLSRLLMQKKGIYNIICGDSVPSPNVIDLILSIEQLRKITYEKLLTTNEIEKSNAKFFEDATVRAESYLKEIRKLEEELDFIKTSSAKEVTALKDKISRLEDDIEKMVTISNEAILQKQVDTISEIETEKQESSVHNQTLENNYEALQVQYEKNLEEYRASELVLRRKNFKIATEVENWVAKYDHDMEEKMVIFEQVEAEYIKEKEEMTRLEEEFAPTEEAYNILMAERAEAERIRQYRLAIETRNNNAATVLQKYVRGFLGRILFRKLREKARAKSLKRKKKARF